MSAQEIIEAAMKLSSEEREVVGEVLLESVGDEWNALDLPVGELENRQRGNEGGSKQKSAFTQFVSGTRGPGQ